MRNTHNRTPGLLLVLFFILPLYLAACGDNPTDTPVPTNTVATTTLTITTSTTATPVTASPDSFSGMLSQMPDTGDTIEIYYSNTASLLKIYGLEGVKSFEEISSSNRTQDLIAATANAFPSRVSGFEMMREKSELGWNFFTIDTELWANQPPGTVYLMRGRFDSAVLDQALTSLKYSKETLPGGTLYNVRPDGQLPNLSSSSALVRQMLASINNVALSKDSSTLITSSGKANTSLTLGIAGGVDKTSKSLIQNTKVKQAADALGEVQAAVVLDGKLFKPSANFPQPLLISTGFIEAKKGESTFLVHYLFDKTQTASTVLPLLSEQFKNRQTYNSYFSLEKAEAKGNGVLVTLKPVAGKTVRIYEFVARRDIPGIAG
jgi:hypothetical protein